MPGVSEATRELNFLGGLNRITPPQLLKDNELTVCDNFWYPKGILTKRPGLFKFNTAELSPAPTDGILILGFADGFYFIRGKNSNANYRVAATTGVVTTLTNADAVSLTWVQYINGTIYAGTTTGGIRTISGTTITTPAIVNTPNSNTSAWHKSRIFSDVSGTPGRIAFSGPVAPGSWAATPTAALDSGTIDVGVEDEESITGLVSLGDLLLIFKVNSTWVMYTNGLSADWVLRKIGSIGAAPSYGNASTYYYNGEVYFVSRIGIYKTNGNSFINISEKVWGATENNFALYPAHGQGQWRITRFVEHLIITGHFELYLNAGLATGYAYTYNLNTGAWTTWSFLGSTIPFDDVLGLPSGTNTSEYTLIASNGNNLYITTDASLDNYDELLAGSNFNVFADTYQYQTAGTGIAYTSTFQSKEFANGVDEFLRMKWLGLEYAAYGSPSFSLINDGVEGSAVTPGFHSTLRKGYKMPGSGRRHSVRLKSSHALTSPYEFYRANLHFTGKIPLVASGTP